MGRVVQLILLQIGRLQSAAMEASLWLHLASRTTTVCRTLGPSVWVNNSPGSPLTLSLSLSLHSTPKLDRKLNAETTKTENENRKTEKLEPERKPNTKRRKLPRKL